MHHMGSGVALGRAVAPLRVDRGDHRVALHELAGLDVDTVCPQGFGDLLYVGDRGLGRRRRARAGDRAVVGDLSAGLRVERLRSRTSSTRSAAWAPWPTTGTRLPSTKMPRIRASEVNSSNPVNSVGPASTSSRYADRSEWACLRAAASALARWRCSAIRPRKPSSSTDRPASAAISRVSSMREAVGVVQGERVGAGQHRGARRPSSHPPPPRTAGSPTASVRLNAVSSATAMRWMRSKSVTSSGYDGPIASRTRRHQLADDRGVDAEQLGRPDDPAQQAAQHVAAAVVSRADAVADDDRRGTAVVGDDAVADVVFVVALRRSRAGRCRRRGR